MGVIIVVDLVALGTIGTANRANAQAVTPQLARVPAKATCE